LALNEKSQLMIDSAWQWFKHLDLTTLALWTATVQLLGAAAAMEAIMKTRTAPGAIAWSLSLLLMPTVMLPLYWVFGRRKFRGYAKARRIGKFESQRPAAHLQQHYPEQLAPFQRVLERIAQMPFTTGNRPALLIDGERTMAAVFAAIAEARHYILLEYYIVRDDVIGMELHARLLAKAREGVAIYFLYDEIGSFQLGRRYLSSLRAGGVDIRSFHSTKGRSNRFQINFRNHRKILVADGTVGILGGTNIGDEYLGHHPVLTPWRDTNLQLRGPAVLSLQLAFVEDWYWACEQVPTLQWIAPPLAAGGVEAIIVPTGPADQLESCALFFQQMAHAAQRRLWIVSPYFVPDAAVINALQLAAMRGVDVRILLPEKPDQRLIWLSSFAYLDEVQSTGIRVFRYAAGFLHQKVWLLDDDCAAIGTANLDNRSFRLNFEINAVIRDRDFASQVEQMLLADFTRSRLLSRGELSARGLPFRMLVRLAHLFAPIQ
jgi:cardiolipin synthase